MSTGTSTLLRARSRAAIRATQKRARRLVKRIEDIAVGDRVWAWDETAGQLTQGRVTRLFRSKSRPVVEVVCSTAAGELQSIVGTTEHPFWVEGKGWTPLSKLAVGNMLKPLAGGTALTVVSVRSTDRTEDVFNFEVDGAHNYFVGGNGVLVHNVSERPKSADAYPGVLLRGPEHVSFGIGSVEQLPTANDVATWADATDWESNITQDFPLPLRHQPNSIGIRHPTYNLDLVNPHDGYVNCGSTAAALVYTYRGIAAEAWGDRELLPFWDVPVRVVLASAKPPHGERALPVYTQTYEDIFGGRFRKVDEPDVHIMDRLKALLRSEGDHALLFVERAATRAHGKLSHYVFAANEWGVGPEIYDGQYKTNRIMEFPLASIKAPEWRIDILRWNAEGVPYDPAGDHSLPLSSFPEASGSGHGLAKADGRLSVEETPGGFRPPPTSTTLSLVTEPDHILVGIHRIDHVGESFERTFSASKLRPASIDTIATRKGNAIEFLMETSPLDVRSIDAMIHFENVSPEMHIGYGGHGGAFARGGSTSFINNEFDGSGLMRVSLEEDLGITSDSSLGRERQFLDLRSAVERKAYSYNRRLASAGEPNLYTVGAWCTSSVTGTMGEAFEIAPVELWRYNESLKHVLKHRENLLKQRDEHQLNTLLDDWEIPADLGRQPTRRAELTFGGARNSGAKVTLESNRQTSIPAVSEGEFDFSSVGQHAREGAGWEWLGFDLPAKGMHFPITGMDGGWPWIKWLRDQYAGQVTPPPARLRDLGGSPGMYQLLPNRSAVKLHRDLAMTRASGIEPLSPADPRFATMVREALRIDPDMRFKWGILPDGRHLVVPNVYRGRLLTHVAASGGADLVSAGEASFYPGLDDGIVRGRYISNFTGHYLTPEDRLTFGIGAFRDAGIEFPEAKLYGPTGLLGSRPIIGNRLPNWPWAP